MKKIYFIKEEFYDIINKFPLLLSMEEDISIQQKDRMFEKVDINQVMESASIFFQKSIMMEENTLYIDHMFQKEIVKIVCENYHMKFDGDRNPFIELMKRKFRYFFIVDSEIGS